MRLKSEPQKLNFLMEKAISKSCQNVPAQSRIDCIHSLLSIKSNKIIKIIHAYIKLHNKYNN